MWSCVESKLFLIKIGGEARRRGGGTKEVALKPTPYYAFPEG